MNIYEHIKKSLISHGIPNEIVKIICEYMKIVILNDKIDKIYCELKNKKYISLTRKEIKDIILYFKNIDIKLSLRNWWTFDHYFWDLNIGKKNLKKLKRTYLYLINKIQLMFRKEVEYVDTDYEILDQLKSFLILIKSKIPWYFNKN